MMAFEVGKTYYARSIYDHTRIYAYKVTARTEKTITLYDITEHITIGRRKVAIWKDSEAVKTTIGTPRLLAENIYKEE